MEVRYLAVHVMHMFKILVHFSKEKSIVIQESRPTPKQTATSATTKISMGKETPLSNADNKRSAVPFNEVSSVYLILPSYAEKHKAEIKTISQLRPAMSIPQAHLARKLSA